MGRKSRRARNSKKANITKRRKEDDADFKQEINSQDDNQLLTIFPEEVWLMILVDKVGAMSKTGNNTHSNCSLASLYFRKLLTDQRKFFLLPKVLESLTNWFENQETKKCTKVNNASSGESDNETENLKANSTFKLTDIFVCRVICPQWNKAIEEFYQNPERYAKMKQDQDKPSRNLFEIKIAYISSYGGIRRYRQPSFFLNYFEITHNGVSNRRNPFPARSIAFKDVHMIPNEDLQSRENIFCAEVSTTLAKYGDNLWHCRMDLEDHNYERRIEAYCKFREWLALMPNLKTLKITCSNLFNATQKDSEEQSGMELNSLPELKSLQFLKVKNVLPVLFNDLLRRNKKTLTQLEIYRYREVVNAGDYDLYSEVHPLSQLRELSINFGSVKHFERMESSAVASNWKLEKFYFLYDKKAEFLEWSRIYRMVSNKWSNSITNLVLKMPVPKTLTEKDSVLEASLSSDILVLPCLKRLKLIVKCPCSIDVLLPLKSTLECLEIIGDYTIVEEEEKRYYRALTRRQRVKFYGYENNQIILSSILEEFPKLKVLSIVTRTNDKEYWSKMLYRFDVYETSLIKFEERIGASWKFYWN